jgi:hypothetical protein
MDTQLSFTLKHWCLWQSTATNANNCWPGGEVLASNHGSADVSFLPMMQRRRLSPLAKAACAVAWRSRVTEGEMPAVFYSAHGESRYYFEMLTDMAAGEAISPGRFSLSVHNAIAGQFSLHSESVLPYVAMAGGSEGMFAAFMEAAGMLLEVPKVMLVCYEQPLPEAYHPYMNSPDNTWALSMVLAKSNQPGQQLQLLREPSDGPGGLPAEQAELIRHILTGQRHGSHRFDHARWCWSLIETNAV